MFRYTVRCSEYILKPLKRAHEKDRSLPLDKIKWNDVKPGVFEIGLPSPLSHGQRKLLESVGVEFVFAV